jgi:hypothetical protein
MMTHRKWLITGMMSRLAVAPNAISPHIQYRCPVSLIVRPTIGRHRAMGNSVILLTGVPAFA